jgi:NAD(P)-dependent dehydrogenase (short-subunit alcohol dehydrogenase family)
MPMPSRRAAVEAASSVYAMTKAAVAQLRRGAALDLAPRRITVNTVQPGPVATNMTADLMEHIVPRLPLGRIGAPEEIADRVAWLTGPNAGYMTGAPDHRRRADGLRRRGSGPVERPVDNRPARVREAGLACAPRPACG